MANMDKAAIENIPQPSTILPGTFRDDDAVSNALRYDPSMGIDDIINLKRNHTPVTAASSSTVPTTTIFSSRNDSSGTKPTSAGTSYYLNGHNNKGKEKAVTTDASSLSATHGSDSDTEREASRHNDLAGLGYWMVDGSRTLKGTAKNVKQPRQKRIPKAKKPGVIIHQENYPLSEDDTFTTRQVPRRDSRRSDTKYLVRRRPSIAKHLQSDLAQAEEGRMSTRSPPAPMPLSRARLVTLVSLVITILLTFALCTFAARYTGKARMRCTKGIIFCGAVLISLLTVFAMTTARRTLQEALLAGLLEFIVGFALLVEIHEFM